MTAVDPCSPCRETSQIAAGPPSAIPMFPPREKRDIPVARFSETMQAVALNPSGWYAAVPSPMNTTKASSHGMEGEKGTSASPAPETSSPSGRRSGSGRRSVK